MAYKSISMELAIPAGAFEQTGEWVQDVLTNLEREAEQRGKKIEILPPAMNTDFSQVTQMNYTYILITYREY